MQEASGMTTTATLPNKATLTITGDVVQLGSGEEDGPEKINILLYTGDLIQRSFSALIFKLSGIKKRSDQIPLLFAHDAERPVGFTDAISTRGSLNLQGELFNESDFPGTKIEEALTVIKGAAKAGFRWQASMGVKLNRVTFVEEGATRIVNGREIEGPANVVEESELLEASILTLGADGGTSSQLLQLKLDESAPCVAVDGGDRMSEQDIEQLKADAVASAQANAREGLTAMLAAFPGREKWAAEQFASGNTEAEAKAQLADLLLVELGKNEEETQQLRERLAVASTEGFSGAPEFQGSDEAPASVNLSADEIAYLDADQVTEMLAPEWGRMSAADRHAFANDVKSYSAYRRAEAAGRVSIRWAKDGA